MKKFGLLMGMMAVSVLGACESSETSGESNYPSRDINGIIQWGEGGATDNVARSLAIQAEEALDASFVMQNREGATGAIATQYVYDQPADGYNVLFGAENPLIYNVLGISERDYIEDFYPVNIIGQGLAGIVVKDDSEFETLEDLVEYAQDNPGDLTLGTSGEGGLPHVVAQCFPQSLVLNSTKSHTMETAHCLLQCLGIKLMRPLLVLQVHKNMLKLAIYECFQLFITKKLMLGMLLH